MELKCEFTNCQSTFFFSGHGRQPHYCIPHRIQINREKAAQWHRAHYKTKAERRLEAMTAIDPEAVIRPHLSHLFTGPGLFEHESTLFNYALHSKAETLNLPMEFVRTTWIHGQAGQEFLQSFMHPENCSRRYA